MSIWSKKGLESPVPPVEASGNALQTSRLCHIENLLFGFYSNTSDLKRIRTFVAKRREMLKIRAFWYLFLLRFDSDFTQTSGQKKWKVEPLVLTEEVTTID